MNARIAAVEPRKPHRSPSPTGTFWSARLTRQRRRRRREVVTTSGWNSWATALNLCAAERLMASTRRGKVCAVSPAW
jgi:hypothetical protein